MANSTLTLKRLGIDTYHEAVLYMNRNCHVCRSEGFVAQSRVQVTLGDRHLIATLNVVASQMLEECEASLSESAWLALGAQEGAQIHVGHPDPLESVSALRAKVYGQRLGDAAWREIVADIVNGHYSNLHLAALVTACAGDRMDADETLSLTRAMVETGERLTWKSPVVVDKHCVGGLPGNRTTLIVVPIVAAAGLLIPKTSSRAITSPAGTADTMEVMAPVGLDVKQMRRVVESEGGCIVWGGNVRLSPADDLLIRVERPLDFDSEGHLVASVLSKKIAAGSTHVVIDMPVGPTAKVRSVEAARALRERFETVGAALGISVDVQVSDGSQPVGRGIGPALEAHPRCGRQIGVLCPQHGPVVGGGLPDQRIGHGQHVTDKQFNVVGRQRLRSRAGRITPLIRCHCMKARSSQGRQLMSPGMVRLRESMQQQDQWLATHAGFFDVVRPRTDLELVHVG